MKSINPVRIHSDDMWSLQCLQLSNIWPICRIQLPSAMPFAFVRRKKSGQTVTPYWAKLIDCVNIDANASKMLIVTNIQTSNTHISP